MRVPVTGPAERERQAQIARLVMKLQYFQRIPPHRREDECADAGEQTCRALLADLGAPGHARPKPADASIRVQTIDEFLEELERDHGQTT